MLIADSNTKLNKDLEEDAEIRRLWSESIFIRDNKPSLDELCNFVDSIL
jgi:hypothetical protein